MKKLGIFLLCFTFLTGCNLKSEMGNSSLDQNMENPPSTDTNMGNASDTSSNDTSSDISSNDTSSDTPSSNEDLNPDENVESEYFHSLTYAEFKNILKEKDAKIIYFGSEMCSACLYFKPIAQKFAKNNKIPIYFLVIDDLSIEERADFDSLLSFEFIPYVTVYQNNEFVYQEDGVHYEEDLKKLVEEYQIGE